MTSADATGSAAGSPPAHVRVRRARSPDGRDWEIRVHRFRRPRWHEVGQGLVDDGFGEGSLSRCSLF
jgi:hypothetical protein